ncbi:MAG: zinc-binding dehydrogenase [Cytophagaceae bacterium]|nr:zinc-binding dehydrogenase [Cytophagaceae bacterium]
MKAAVIQAVNQPIQLTDVEKPRPEAGEVLVQLRAAALNHRDVWVQKGLYPGMRLPVVPGSDGAGVVVELGEGVRTSWLGRRVIINPALDWGDNTRFYSREFRILGMPDAGTFAEFIRIPTKYLHAKPEHLSFEEAAALPLGGLTAWRALFSRGRLRSGERVLISGVGGGVALFALQFAIATGADVWVTSGSEEKLERAKAMGALGGANYNTPKWEKEFAAQMGGFDLIIDSAAGAGFSKLIDAAAPGGRIVFYGGTRGNIAELIAPKIFFKQLDIMGTTMGTEAEFTDMVAFVESRKLQPVLDRSFFLDDAEAALRYLEAGEQFGKIGLKIEG